MSLEPSNESGGLLTIEDVQKSLNRSRASIYRYANTDPNDLNPPRDPKKLNPEFRESRDDPLLFHPNEVARFATDILKVRPVTIQIKEPTPTSTESLLQAILTELQSIHELLRSRS